MFPSNFQNVQGAVPQHTQGSNANLLQGQLQVPVPGRDDASASLGQSLVARTHAPIVRNHVNAAPSTPHVPKQVNHALHDQAPGGLQGAVQLGGHQHQQQSLIQPVVKPAQGFMQGHVLQGLVQRVPGNQANLQHAQQLWQRTVAAQPGGLHLPQKPVVGHGHQIPVAQPVQGQIGANPGYVSVQALQGYQSMQNQQRQVAGHGHGHAHGVMHAARQGPPQVLGSAPMGARAGVQAQYQTPTQSQMAQMLKSYQSGVSGFSSQIVGDGTGSGMVSSSGVPMLVPAQNRQAGIPPGMVPIQQQSRGIQQGTMVHGRVLSSPAMGTSGQGVGGGSSAFTHAQMAVLRQQILAFKRIKKGELHLPPDVLAQTRPVPINHPAARQAAVPVQNSPAVHSAYGHMGPGSHVNRQIKPSGVGHHPGVAQSINHLTQVQQKQQEKEVQPPIRRFQSALYNLTVPEQGTGRGHASRASGFQIGWDVTKIMTAERDTIIRRKRKRTMEGIEEKLAKKTAPGFSRNAGNALGKGMLMLKLRQSRLLEFQKQLRRVVEGNQEDIMRLNERTYRKFVRDCNRHRFEMFKQSEKAKSDLAQERAQACKKMKVAIMERVATVRDYRVVRNKGVLRVHERLARQHNKQKDDDRVKRLEALKARDFEAYQELVEQSGQSAAGERYAEISKFLTETEEYLNRLAGKVASVKLSQEASEAAAQAIADARDQGLSEEEVQIAAREAAQEVASNSQLVRRSQNFSDAQSRYYSLAHSVEEQITRQPSLLRPPDNARLRDYQMVGLQWMVSLYNNRLNGILADEMGLGKTVQVMSLIAYLMERKENYGPHLIIVPNAVIVNWKSELMQWLPSVRCVYYVGNKEERARKYQTEVQAMQFNVLVTTYEFIMRDRSKLSKIQWRYLVIDEAQRMKDRQSKLAKDLDCFTASRRLLLTGTPLQNELRELWSLLNLLLPEVFDDKTSFTEWFGDVLGQGAQGDQDGDADGLEMEKRVVVIHRLHQILEPFMLRRQVEDVERKLPAKIPVVVKVQMSAYQSNIYNWVKATGTIRMDPSGPMLGQKRHAFAPLNNKVMELRKVCNHPLLSYPHQEYTGEGLVRQCGKLHVLDRLLIKLYHAGHRVLLFSTMTRLLDILELYLKWRTVGDKKQLKYRRIDGGTPLEERENAIKAFNAPGSDVFIFLLSIRAAGRGLNLQSADTVVIFDPDANPKNEEQAIARAHRIGQTKEVRVIYLEAVADPMVYDNGNGVNGPMASNSSAGSTHSNRKKKQYYVDSIESLVRNTIQKQKIEMANEVIDAGRFDMQTTNDERRKGLQSLLEDEDRFKNPNNQVPSVSDLNAMIARSPEEEELFRRLDRELPWPRPLLSRSECPDWVLFDDHDVINAIKVTNLNSKKARHRQDIRTVAANDAPGKRGFEGEYRRTRGSRRPCVSGEYQEDQVDEEAEEDVTEVPIDEDDMEEVLEENIKMDMDDTGTTDLTGDGVSVDQTEDGGSNRVSFVFEPQKQRTPSEGPVPSTTSMRSDGSRDQTIHKHRHKSKEKHHHRELDTEHPVVRIPVKKDEKRKGALTVRFKSSFGRKK